MTRDMQAGKQSRPVRPVSAANGRAVAAPHTAEPLADCVPAMH